MYSPGLVIGISTATHAALILSWGSAWLQSWRGEVVTALGSPIAIAADGGFIVLNGAATITLSNVEASNGIAHVVNTVLTPVAPA